MILDHYHVSRWVFGVDTGHAGTQTLSREECFEPVMDQLVWDFEAHHGYGDGREKRDLGLKVWYAELARLFPSSRKMESRRFVEQVLLPDSLFHAKWLSKRPSTNLTFIDLGHHINLGLMGPLASLLMPNISFVRVIRSRYDTVRSFLAESKRPCYSGMWTLCPLWHPDIVLKPPSTGMGANSMPRSRTFGLSTRSRRAGSSSSRGIQRFRTSPSAGATVSSSWPRGTRSRASLAMAPSAVRRALTTLTGKQTSQTRRSTRWIKATTTA